MGVIVNPLRGRLGYKVYWRLLVPQWGDRRAVEIQRLSVYVIGLFLWMFRFIFKISRKRLRFFIIDWISTVVAFRGDVFVVYFELFDYANYRRLVQNVLYDRWLQRNVRVFNTLLTVLRNNTSSLALMMQKAMFRIFWLMRERLRLATFHGTFRMYFYFMFTILRVSLLRISQFFGMTRVLVKLMPVTPMKWTTAYLIGAWCLMKVDEGFKPKQILTRVISGCKSIKGLEGFKICLTGRFTRRQASTFSWLAGGQSGAGFFVDRAQYATVSGVSQFGSCSIKIWLRYV